MASNHAVLKALFGEALTILAIEDETRWVVCINGGVLSEGRTRRKACQSAIDEIRRGAARWVTLYA